MAKEPDAWEAGYYLFALLTGGIVFLGSWIYCAVAYGFLFGVGLGWLPSAIVGFLAGLLWPLVWAAVAFLAYLIFR